MWYIKYKSAAVTLRGRIAGATVDLVQFFQNCIVFPNGRQIRYGTGTPEGVITGVIGDLFLRTDGGASTTLYVKTSGTGNTGWTAK